MAMKFQKWLLINSAVTGYCFWGASQSLGMPLPTFLSFCVAKIYSPNPNICPSPLVGKINLTVLFYAIASSCALLTIIAESPPVIFRVKEKTFLIYLRAMAASFCLYMLFQTVGQSLAWNKTWHYLRGKPLSQKSEALYGQAHFFARRVRRILPGRHVARVISDLDFNLEPHMATRGLLAYLLYPIDINGIIQGETDCLLFYEKVDAAQSVPEGFRILEQFNDCNLVAVRTTDAHPR